MSNTRETMLQGADAVDGFFDRHPGAGKTVRALVALVAAATLPVVTYKAGQSSKDNEWKGRVVSTGYRAVHIGETADVDEDPATPDTPMNTISDIAKVAARVGAGDYGELVADLTAQLDTVRGENPGTLQPGREFKLPMIAQGMGVIVVVDSEQK